MTESFEKMINETRQTRQVWVVFTNQTELPWVRIFKQGFRHCFILINDGNNWISVDPMANYMDVVVHHVPAAFDLSGWLEQRGHHLVETQISTEINKSAPWMLFTCVEACKRILGIHSRSIFTPWQLYQYLNSEIREKSVRRTVFSKLREKFYHKGVFSWEV